MHCLAPPTLPPQCIAQLWLCIAQRFPCITQLLLGLARALLAQAPTLSCYARYALSRSRLEARACTSVCVCVRVCARTRFCCAHPQDPARYTRAVVAAGASSITFHVDAPGLLGLTLEQLQAGQPRAPQMPHLASGSGGSGDAGVEPDGASSARAVALE